MLKLRSVVAFLIIVAAGPILFDANSITRLIWKIRYGHHQIWEGIDIRLADNEYFMPIKHDGDTLFIRDDNSTSLIFLRVRNFTPDEIRSYAERDCKILKCLKVDEQEENIGKVGVISLSYIVDSLDEPFLHQQRLVKGSGIWIQYTGPLSRYRNSKGTLDQITKMLAHKVEMNRKFNANS